MKLANFGKLEILNLKFANHVRKVNYNLVEIHQSGELKYM